MKNIAAIIAQQLTLFPGAPPPSAPPVASQSTTAFLCPDLERYTDLTLSQVFNLALPAQAPTVLRNAFQRAGWIEEEGTLTKFGTYVLQRALAIMDGKARLPAPVLDVPGSVRFRIRHADRWRAVHLKCLLYLARSPGTAWRYLTGVFSVPVVETLQDAGLIFYDRHWGAPQRITKDGLVVLRAALDRAGVTYYSQAKEIT